MLLHPSFFPALILLLAAWLPHESHTDTIRLAGGAPPRPYFLMPIEFYSPSDSSATRQVLTFGITEKGWPTTREEEHEWHLDSAYRERELSRSGSGTFSAWWVIEGRHAAVDIIHIESLKGNAPAWQGETNSVKGPTVIRWSRKDARHSPYQLIFSDLGQDRIKVDMKTGRQRTASGIMVRRQGDDTMEIVIMNPGIQRFGITRAMMDDDFEPQPFTAPTLHQNVPNPFTARTEIEFFMPQRGAAKLSVFDNIGTLRRILLDDTLKEGMHSVEWDGMDAEGQPAATGTYICRLQTAGELLSMKMLLFR